jgi:SAM-dependent methyltransferase
MTSLKQRLIYEIEHRMPFRLKSTTVPNRDLQEAVGNGSTLARRRALDLGCGTGRNAIYLAAHGWDVTAIELIGKAIRAARRNAAAAGVAVRFIHGDASRLSDYGIGEGFDLIVDSFCYHAIHQTSREAYAGQVTSAANVGAQLLMTAFDEQGDQDWNVTHDELAERFVGWKIITSEPMTGEELLDYTSGPNFATKLLTNGKYSARRYRMARIANS